MDGGIRKRKMVNDGELLELGTLVYVWFIILIS